MPYASLSDHELAVLLKDKDAHAFSEIYQRYWPILFIHTQKMLQDEDLAQDLIQDVFAKIWYKAESVDMGNNISGYLYVSVRNAVLNQIRHEKTSARHLENLAAYLSEGYFILDEEMRYKELIRVINGEVVKMPERMRLIFELSRNKELSHKEIAEQLNISEHTVRKHIQRALQKLRVKLNIPIILILLLYTDPF